MTDESPPTKDLRRGWTTGSCATAAARAAWEALLTGTFPDPVAIRLPSGDRPSFALAMQELGVGFAKAGVIKDAGDDPDVTHGALVMATVSRGAPGTGVSFRAGSGVGTVTKPGLPLPVGEPAINPVPRQMITWAIEEAAAAAGVAADAIVEVSIEHGEKLAERTLNGRLGILGGLSVLGTTGIVVPFSCAAWIHSIHRGIDVSRALGLDHVAGATGSTSEAAVQKLHGLQEVALLDMGDFVGGTLKYLAKHPVPKVTIALGIGKSVKLAQGLLDLHSKRGSVDLAALAGMAVDLGGRPELAEAISAANSALHALTLARDANIDLAPEIALRGWATAAKVIAGCGMALEVVIFDRDGQLLATTGLRPA